MVHIWFGLPPGPVDIWWISLQGCLIGPDDDPSKDRRCLACDHRWSSRDPGDAGKARPGARR